MAKEKKRAKSTVLSFGAHPDDIEIGCGGAEIQLIQQGYKIYHVCVTSGEKGSPAADPKRLAKTRESEAVQAGKVIGVEEVFFLRLQDGLTSYRYEDRIQIVDLIRKLKPEIVFVHSQKDSFSDHQIATQLVLSGIWAAAAPVYPECKGEPWRVQKIYGYEVWHPLSHYQLALDVTSVIEQKLKALQCHQSQVEFTRYDEAFRGLARYRGVMSFIGEYAEVFEVIQLSQI